MLSFFTQLCTDKYFILITRSFIKPIHNKNMQMLQIDNVFLSKPNHGASLIHLQVYHHQALICCAKYLTHPPDKMHLLAETIYRSGSWAKWASLTHILTLKMKIQWIQETIFFVFLFKIPISYKGKCPGKIPVCIIPA